MTKYAVMTQAKDDWLYVCESSNKGYNEVPRLFDTQESALKFSEAFPGSMVVSYTDGPKPNLKSVREGYSAEEEFANLRRSTFVRYANREENILEHWDLLDSEFGHVDVKAPKRKNRGGDLDYHIWWELKTVKRPPDWKSVSGWGIPNHIDRLIAVRGPDAYHLVAPEDIVEDLRLRCRDYSRKPFGLHARKDRGDLMTTLPLWYVQEHARFRVDVHS